LRADVAGDFAGAPVTLDARDQGLIAKPKPCGAIHNAQGEGFTYFEASSILDGSWQAATVDWRRGVKLFGPDEAVKEMRDALAGYGAEISNWRPLQPPDGSGEGVQVAQEFEITPIMRRGIAKIAFNYLAYRQGTAFVLTPSFDSIRRFVRYGDEPDVPPVHSSLDVALGPERVDGMRPVVHWLELTSHRNHRNLLGKVVLFGFMTHTVILAPDFDGPWFDLPVAHLFNVKQLSVSEPPRATASLAP
jgi:hypothetical protein